MAGVGEARAAWRLGHSLPHRPRVLLGGQVSAMRGQQNRRTPLQGQGHAVRSTEHSSMKARWGPGEGVGPGSTCGRRHPSSAVLPGGLVDM